MKYVYAVLAALGLLLLGTALPANAAETEYEDVRISESTQQYSSTGWGGWGCHDGAPDFAEWDGYVAFDYEVIAEHDYEVFPTEAGMPHNPGNLNGYSVHNGQTPQSITLKVSCGLPKAEPEPEPEPTDEPTEEPVDEDPVDEDPKDEAPVVEDDEDADPVAVPTEIPAGEQLPKTGVSPVLAGLVGAGLLGAGGGLLAWKRRKVANS